MDPISSLIAVWLVVLFLTTRAPKLLMESRDGETAEAYAARLKRLADAGVLPATGSPLRQYVGNAWRDYLLERQERRRAKAAASSTAPSWGSRQVDRALDWWRERHADATRPNPRPDATGGGDPADMPSPTPEPTVDTETPPAPTDLPDEDGDEQWEAETVEDTAHWGPFPAGDAQPRDDAELIRVESTAGDPIPDPPTRTTQPALEGADMTTAVARGGEVTGVVSGANEARAIQRQVEAIRDAYNAALRQLGQRIVNLGEQAHANVELRTSAPVMNSIAQAAETCAAAIAHANSSAAEVSGALEVVKRGFNRLNS